MIAIMKKTLYILFALCAVVLVSCNKNRDEVRVYEHTAAQDIAGKYVGTWHCTSTTGTDTIYNGEIEFQVWQDSIADVCFIYPRCAECNPAFDLRGLTNVAHAGDDIVFNNDKPAGNGIGTAFYGRVNAKKEATMSMTLQGREGRKTVLLSYDFFGTKQN